MSHLWLLDNGHGGIIDGIYQTSGKRSPIMEDGRQMFEGVNNREIVQKIVKLSPLFGVECEIIVPEQEDISLEDRVSRATKHFYKNQNKRKCVYVSIHHDAFGTSWGSPNGATTFYYGTDNYYSKQGKILAEIFQKNIVDKTPLRNRGVKKANYYVLRETPMYAVLTENGFMTNKKNFEYINSEEGKWNIAVAHLSSMKYINEKIKWAK